MGSVGCCQRSNEISNKLNECPEDGDRIVYLQEETLEKNKIDLSRFGVHCQNGDSAIECIAPANQDVNQTPEMRQVRLIACCVEEQEAVPIEPNEHDYRSDDASRVFYLMEEAIALEQKTDASEGYLEDCGGFYEVGTLVATDYDDRNSQGLAEDKPEHLTVSLSGIPQPESTRESGPSDMSFLDSAKAPSDSCQHVEDQSDDSRPPLIVFFQSGDDTFPICFTRRPLGITCSDDAPPVKVAHVAPGSISDTLGVMPGWSFQAIGEADVSNMEWKPFLECLKQATDALPRHAHAALF